MNKALIFGARMRAKATKIVSLEESIDDLTKRSALEAEKLERAETEEEVSVVEKSLENIQKELEEKQAEKEQLEKEIEDLQKQIDEQNRKAPSYGNDKDNHGGNKKMEQREAIATFIRSFGQQRDITGLKTTDSGSAALIPVEILQPKFVEKTRNPLLDLVKRIKVSSGSGKYPVIKKTDNKMVSVTELKENPELAKPKIEEIDYSIKTYRGYVPVSQEMIDDANFDIMSIVEDEVFNQGENTELSLITTVFKSATQANATGLDGLKDIFNVKLKAVYNASIVVTRSMYNALDKIKNKNGDYMLQQDITSPTGYSFAGKTIYVVDDTVFGSESEMKFFIGDIEQYLALFDRLQVSVKWVNNDIYGQLLGLFIRLDVKQTDKEAGFFGTYTDALG